MRRWAQWLCLALLAAAAATGCHNANAGVSVTVTPTAATVLLNNGSQFTATVTGSTNAVTWSVNSVSGGNSTVGTVDSTGLYTAPATIPPNTTITVTATVQNTTTTASATVTLVSGLTITITPSTFSIGTAETLPFSATVTGVPFNAVTATCNTPNPTSTLPLCTAVTWTLTGVGSIDPNTGLYTASSTAGTATITATSIYDTGVTANATVTVVTAADPTITSVSPRVGAIGSVFQDVYLSGTNFISTSNVFINGVQMPATAILAASSTVLRVRVPYTMLSTTPTPPVEYGDTLDNRQPSKRRATTMLSRSHAMPSGVVAGARRHCRHFPSTAFPKRAAGPQRLASMAVFMARLPATVRRPALR